MVGIGQPKPLPTGLKRPYSADTTEKQHSGAGVPKNNQATDIVPSLKDLVGFVAPRDCDDANYTLLPRALYQQTELTESTVLARYHSALPFVSGHTMTNSTSINLPKHWFSTHPHQTV